VHRSRKKNTTSQANYRPPSIIVRFTRRDKRTEFIKACRAARLSQRAVGLNSDEPLYINEHLTAYSKQLLAEAKKRGRDKEWTFVWTRDCKIFARKHPGSKILYLREMADIEKML